MLNNKIFLEHGKCCPVCNQKLSLYLSINNIGTFKCSNNFVKNKNNKLTFYPLKDKTFGLSAAINKSDTLTLKVLKDDKFSMTFSSESLFRAVENNYFNFFHLCNLKSIKYADGDDSINNYYIQSYDACYYKVSNDLLIKSENNITKAVCVEDRSCRMEAFSLHKDNKRYCLMYDFNNNKTSLFFINLNDKDKKTDANFVKHFELLEYYPDFSNREKVINKFNSWIYLS